MKRIVLAVTAFSCLLFPAAETSVCVIDLRAGEGCTVQEAKTVSDALRKKVAGTAQLRLIDRSRVDQVIASMGKISCTDADCASRIGKMVSADKAICGTVIKMGQVVYVDVQYVNVKSASTERTSKQASATIDRIDEACADIMTDFLGAALKTLPEPPRGVIPAADTKPATTEVALAVSPFLGGKFVLHSVSPYFGGAPIPDTGLQFTVDTVFFGRYGFRVMLGYELSIASRPLPTEERVFFLNMIDTGLFFLARLSPELYCGFGAGYKFQPFGRPIYTTSPLVPTHWAVDASQRRGETFARALVGYNWWMSDTFGLSAEGYAGYSYLDENEGATHYLDAGICVRAVFRVYKSLK